MINRELSKIRRRSVAAGRSLPEVLRLAATAIRDRLLDKDLNTHLDYCADTGQEAAWGEAIGSLNAAREIAVQLGLLCQGERSAGFSLQHWYRACGLDENGDHLASGYLGESASFRAWRVGQAASNCLPSHAKMQLS